MSLALVAVCVVLGATLVAALTIRGREQHSKALKPTSTGAGNGARLAESDLVTGYLAGTTSDTAAVTSYDYRSLGDALDAGLSVTTGGYQKSYKAALTGDVVVAAKRNHTVQTFDLTRVGIGAVSADGTSAKVLVFDAEVITDDSTGAGARADAVTLTATVEHHGDSYLISALEVGSNAGLPPGTPQLTVAAEAARAEVVNLLSYRHAHFDADYTRALAGAADPLRSQIISTAADRKASIVTGTYDLAGSVSAIALERADGDTVVLLVAATGNRVDADGTSTTVTDGRYEVTVVQVGGKWVTSEVSPVGST